MRCKFKDVPRHKSNARTPSMGVRRSWVQSRSAYDFRKFAYHILNAELPDKSQLLRSSGAVLFQLADLIHKPKKRLLYTSNYTTGLTLDKDRAGYCDIINSDDPSFISSASTLLSQLMFLR